VVPGEADECEEETDDDAGCEREVEAEVLAFDGDVAGELSEERNFGSIADEKASHYAENANEYKELAHGIFFYKNT